MSVLSDIPSNTRCEGVHKFVDPRLGCSLGYESSFRKVDPSQLPIQTILCNLNFSGYNTGIMH